MLPPPPLPSPVFPQSLRFAASLVTPMPVFVSLCSGTGQENKADWEERLLLPPTPLLWVGEGAGHREAASQEPALRAEEPARAEEPHSKHPRDQLPRCVAQKQRASAPRPYSRTSHCLKTDAVPTWKLLPGVGAGQALRGAWPVTPTAKG